MSSSPLQIQNVQVRYSLSWKRKAVVALTDFNLELRRGEIFALLGPNGSGKTTTFKIILGFLKPKIGSVLVEGVPAGSRAARQRVGYLPENPYFPRYLTGLEVVESYGRLSGLSSKELKSRIEMIVEVTQMGGFAHKPLQTYSKGMVQRVSLAQALIHDPQLLLLDEPTTGLDPQGVDAMRESMKRLRDMGKTILFTSHLMEQVETLADRVAIIYQGKKLVQGSMKELLEENQSLSLRLSGQGIPSPQEIEKWLREKGADQVECRSSGGTLENLFRKYTS